MGINEMVMLYPKASLAVVSLVVTLLSTIAHKYLTDQKNLKRLKKRQKEIQKELKGCKDDEILKELNLEIMQITMTMLKGSMKPMFVTIVPFLMIFAWVKDMYGGADPLISGWIWWYLGFAVVFSMVLRKVMKVA